MRGCVALAFTLKSAHPSIIQAAPYGAVSPTQNSKSQAAPVMKANRNPSGTAMVSSNPPKYKGGSRSVLKRAKPKIAEPHTKMKKPTIKVE